MTQGVAYFGRPHFPQYAPGGWPHCAGGVGGVEERRLGNVRRDFDAIGIYGGFEWSWVMVENQKGAGTGTETGLLGSFLPEVVGAERTIIEESS